MNTTMTIRCAAANLSGRVGQCRHAATTTTGSGHAVCGQHAKQLAYEPHIWGHRDGRLSRITR